MYSFASLATLAMAAALAPTSLAETRDVPDQVLVIDQKSFNVMDTVLPYTESNISTTFYPPGYSQSTLKSKPFHVYDSEFLDILGDSPSLALIASQPVNPLYHEAPVWYPPTDDFFFVQSAGAEGSGTGLHKSNIIQKINLKDAASVAAANAKAGKTVQQVNVTTLDEKPKVVNANGGTNWRGQVLVVAQGQGTEKEPQIQIMNPVAPYNTTTLLNNYFGRQFNSLNDIRVNPINQDIYFTDTLYGRLQDFRPAPGLPNQVYRLNPDTGAVTVVADGFDLPNGLTFDKSGKTAYVSDTGALMSFYGTNQSAPASIYRFDVNEQDGTFENRKLFAYTDRGIPDGIHTDSKGNVYAGVGDGVAVWNPKGTLLGKIFLDTTAVNLNFAGKGRMVILADTEMYYVTLAAEGASCIDEC